MPSFKSNPPDGYYDSTLPPWQRSDSEELYGGSTDQQVADALTRHISLAFYQQQQDLNITPGVVNPLLASIKSFDNVSVGGGHGNFDQPSHDSNFNPEMTDEEFSEIMKKFGSALEDLEQPSERLPLDDRSYVVGLDNRHRLYHQHCPFHVPDWPRTDLDLPVTPIQAPTTLYEDAKAPFRREPCFDPIPELAPGRQDFQTEESRDHPEYQPAAYGAFHSSHESLDHPHLSLNLSSGSSEAGLPVNPQGVPFYEKNFRDFGQAQAYLDRQMTDKMVPLPLETDDWEHVRDTGIDYYAFELFQALRSHPPVAPDHFDDSAAEYYFTHQNHTLHGINHLLQTNQLEAEARVLVLLSEVIGLHEHGVPQSVLSRTSIKAGFKPETTLTCSQRMEKVVEIAAKDKYIAHDILSGTNLKDIVRSPVAALRRKIENCRVNAKKATDKAALDQARGRVTGDRAPSEASEATPTRHQKTRSLAKKGSALERSGKRKASDPGLRGKGPANATSRVSSTGREETHTVSGAKFLADGMSDLEVDDQNEMSSKRAKF